MDKIIKESCDKMNELDENISPEEINEQMEIFMGTILISNYADLEKEYGITLENIENEDEVFDDFTQKFAIELLTKCPKFLEIISKLPDDEEDDKVYNQKPQKSIEGKFLKMEGDDFVFITIKDTNGRTQKLFWGASFPGDGELMNAKKLKGKTVVISYTEKECYNAKLKDYSTLKEITSLEVR